MDKQKLPTIYCRREAYHSGRSPAARRHSGGGLSQERGQPWLVYRWRAVTQQATTAALQQVDSRGKSQPDPTTARLQAELERMRKVVAEITAENLELKKKT